MGKISNGESTGRPLQADFDCPRLPTILLSITARLWQARHLLDWSERAFGWVRLKKGFRAFQFNRCPYDRRPREIGVMEREAAPSGDRVAAELKLSRNLPNLWGPARHETIVNTLQMASIGGIG